MAKQMTLASISATVKSSGLQMLDNVLAETIKKDDLQQIVGTFVEKAKQGHIPSANFLLKMLGADSAPQTVVVNNFADEQEPQESVRVVDAKRTRTTLEQVTVYLSAAGEASPESIAEQLQLDVESVVQALDANPSRFAVRGNKYSLARPGSV
ncbi:hypothetical protein [Schlesneria sp. T3-172]|uniref:hypothetical protein n=1 Tax=Schlesneria sphaerica TaxID=3373610 RepID=UPI0037CC5D90